MKGFFLKNRAFRPLPFFLSLRLAVYAFFFFSLAHFHPSSSSIPCREGGNSKNVVSLQKSVSHKKSSFSLSSYFMVPLHLKEKKSVNENKKKKKKSVT